MGPPEVGVLVVRTECRHLEDVVVAPHGDRPESVLVDGSRKELDEALRAGVRCEVPVVRLAPKQHVTQRATDDVRRMPVGPERPHQVVDSRRDRALDRGP